MISICMIAKNEENILDKCLNALKKLPYELIIVDTGSTDKTKEIAKRYTDKVFDYKWDNNFSNARNYSISKASNEFVLIVDSDEILEDVSLKELEKAVANNQKSIGRIERKNTYISKGTKLTYKERVNRLFNKRYYKYEGSIHEQVVPIEDKKNIITYNLPVVYQHIGYEENEKARKNKSSRNIEMLKYALKVKGDDPYLLYQLGKAYYMDKKYELAVLYFGKALEFDLDIRLEYVIDLVESYGYALLQCEKYEQALDLLGVYNEFNDGSDFVYLIALIYMNNGLFKEAIREFLKCTKMKNEKILGVNSYLSFYNIGIIYECLGNIEEAVKYYVKCDGYEAAKTRLKEIYIK